MKFILLLFVLSSLVFAGCASGEPAPDVNLFPLGKTTKLKLSDLKGKVVLIDAWATWCGPCRATMPTVQKLYDEFKDKGLEVVAVSDESPTVIQKFVKESLYTYPIYVDADASLNTGFKIVEIPATFVIDRSGNVIYEGHGESEDALRKAVVQAIG